MRLVAPPDNGILGFRHERVALLPCHRCEAAAFLPANLVEDDPSKLAIRCASACQRANTSRNLDCGFRLLDRWRCLRLRHDALIPGLYPCSFLLGPHVSVPPRTVANHKWQSLRSKPP